MKFFLPAADDETQAENVYDSIKKFAEEQTGWRTTPRRIFSLSYRHEGKDYHAEIGKVHGRIGEIVIAILETNNRCFLVCSPNRCVLRGEPMLVGDNEVRELVDFEQ